MTEYKFELSDYYDILNLYKIIMEAKFNPNPVNDEVSRSPFTAKFCLELVNILTNYELDLKGQDRWTEWRKLSNHSDYKKRIIMLIRDYKKWSTLTPEEKQWVMKNYLSPFLYSEEELNEFIHEVDENL